MQILHVIGFEWHCSIKHRKKHNSCRPQISLKSLVTFVSDDFGSDVGWSPGLLVHDLVGLHWFTDAKISYFDIPFTIEQNVVKLYVTMQNFLAVDVANALNYLFE